MASNTEKFYSEWQLGLVAGQRLGQAAYNAAHLVYGGVVENVNDTLFDPFNDDSAIPLFLRWLEVNAGGARRLEVEAPLRQADE